MIDVLILNHTTKNCGVYQFGKRVAELAIRSEKLDVRYYEIDTEQEYEYLVEKLQPKMIIFNWYPITMQWLSFKPLKDHIKSYFFFHDGHYKPEFEKMVFLGVYEKADGHQFNPEKKILLPRPLLDYESTYNGNELFTVGSFGFGFYHKGFPDIVSKINEEFDEAVVNLHIPKGHFGDPHGEQAEEVRQECLNRNKKPGIIVNITTELKSEKELLDFLGKNDINAFFYGGVSEGISSVIDYALSVKRPIALTNNMMFRHVISDDILIEKNTFQEIFDRQLAPLEKFLTDWSTENFIKEFDRVIQGELDAPK